MGFRYALALGSNRRTVHGSPERTLLQATKALGRAGLAVEATSPILRTPALGPAGRGFANAAFLIETPLEPEALLSLLKQIERDFGRRPGRRWGPRPLDLDIALWSGGRWPRGTARAAPGALTIPHPELTRRRFVLDPLVTIAPGWRVWPSGRTVAALRHRLRQRT